jgi:peptide/nickel transport system permease protein
LRTAEPPASAVPEPGALERAVRRPGRRRLLRRPTVAVGATLTSLVVVVATFADQLAPSDPFEPVARPLQSPSRAHLMGTDHLGRDTLSGVIQGAQTSLQIVVWVTLISLVVGLVLGTVAGYRGGVVDDVVTRLAELVQSVPRFFLTIVVVTWLGRGSQNLIVLLGLTSWPLLARVVRAETLSVRRRDFVEAARSLGASNARIVLRHVLPQTVPVAIVVISVTASRVILLEASLAFLGLTDPNAMSWGNLINNAQSYLRQAWWMSVFPGAAIAVATIGCNLLSDGLNDLLNPTLASEVHVRGSRGPAAVT